MKNALYAVLFVAGCALVALPAPRAVEGATRRSRSVEVKVTKSVREHAHVHAYASDCAGKLESDCDKAEARRELWPHKVKTRTRSRSRGESDCDNARADDCDRPAKVILLRPRPVILIPPATTSEKPTVKVEVQVTPAPTN